MDTTPLFQWLVTHQRVIRLAMAPLLLLMIATVTAVVYATGGIRYVYSHSMYIPILLSGFVFGVRGGLLFGLLGALALGPFMPIDTDTGEAQRTVNWLYRTGFFLLIGGLSGLASDGVRRYLQQLNWAARHDAVTGLRNRFALFADLGAQAARKGEITPKVLMVVSLENAMALKSAFGFDVVETLVAQLAQRFKQLAPGRYDLYRIDNEQLAVVAPLDDPSVDVVQPIDALAMQLLDAARQPVLHNDVPIHAEVRIGHVRIERLTDHPETCLQQAEAALVVAHEQLREQVSFSADIHIATRDNLSLLGELTHAIEQGQLSLHYQPKVALADGTLVGVEALMRWQHPERGAIPPGVFIPRAEQSTLIHMVTEFALLEAMAQSARWRQRGLHIPVAVNISPRNLLQPDFGDLVMALLARHDLSGEMLELEVTEGALMTDMDRAIDELSRLAGIRIAISIDDFGTGYSSLQYLHQLPISAVKIDQSFVRRLPDDNGAVHIVQAATTLARNMGIKTVAEGVEEQSMYDAVRELGCDVAQGYLIARPLPAAEFDAWLAARRGQ